MRHAGGRSKCVNMCHFGRVCSTPAAGQVSGGSHSICPPPAPVGTPPRHSFPGLAHPAGALPTLQRRGAGVFLSSLPPQDQPRRLGTQPVPSRKAGAGLSSSSLEGRLLGSRGGAGQLPAAPSPAPQPPKGKAASASRNNIRDGCLLQRLRRGAGSDVACHREARVYFLYFCNSCFFTGGGWAGICSPNKPGSFLYTSLSSDAN